VSDFSLIYAGAQKNMGPAGATLVIVKDEVLGKTGRQIPTMLDYTTHIKKESMFNTPPVFPVYVSMLTLEWLKANGGIPSIEVKNMEKATLLYNEIDNNPLFTGTANMEDRSTMNPTFILKNDSLTEAFMEMVAEKRINGLKGHRSVGGFRASMYNAMPIESVQILVNVMKEFAGKYSE
jgi:phosphoserine aminotransferase